MVRCRVQREMKLGADNHRTELLHIGPSLQVLFYLINLLEITKHNTTNLAHDAVRFVDSDSKAASDK